MSRQYEDKAIEQQQVEDRFGHCGELIRNSVASTFGSRGVDHKDREKDNGYYKDDTLIEELPETRRPPNWLGGEPASGQ